MISLKIDFVNDLAVHFGKIKDHKQLGRIDSVRNILSNKIGALYRFEPKDVCDIWIIAKKYEFMWPEVMYETKEKEAGIDILLISEIISGFPVELIDAIKWQIDIDKNSIKRELTIISEDILMNRYNSLYKKDNST